MGGVSSNLDPNELFANVNTLPSPLSKEKAYELIEKSHLGDKKAKTKLIEHNIRLVIYQVTHQFHYVDYDKKELVAIGIIGLMKGIDHFDTQKNVEFSTFVTRCINNEIGMFLRRLKKYEIEETLEKPISIDNEENSLKIEDVISNETNILREYTDKELKKRLQEIIKELSNREKKIIMLFFGFYNDKIYSQKEIATMLGLSQSYVSRLILQTVKKIGLQLKEEGMIDLKSRTPIKKVNVKSIYDILEGSAKEEINQVISCLSKEEKNLLTLRYGEDLENPKQSDKWTREDAVKFYNILLPKIKKLLATSIHINQIETSKESNISEEENNLNL